MEASVAALVASVVIVLLAIVLCSIVAVVLVRNKDRVKGELKIFC